MIEINVFATQLMWACGIWAFIGCLPLIFLAAMRVLVWDNWYDFVPTIVFWPATLIFIWSQVENENNYRFDKECRKYEVRFGQAPKSKMREILRKQSHKSLLQLCQIQRNRIKNSH